ncbi:Tc toxin subunit A [Pseudomonas fluorescens]|nr:Tc toxin subunit A [Pseudomonas fluorescens]
MSFKTAMQKMGFTSVFDIIRLPRAEFAEQLARLSDADAHQAYDNAMGYAQQIARLYREHQISSGAPQHLGQRTGVRALLEIGPGYQNLFGESWDEFCKTGALAAVDGPVAYLNTLYTFIKELEASSKDDRRVVLDKRRPDIKELLINEDTTNTPIPMLNIVNEVLTQTIQSHLKKDIYEELASRRYPFEFPYNLYHHQCLLGLTAEKPGLGELNYRVSMLLPLTQNADNAYGQVLTNPSVEAQRLLSGLSTEQQTLLIERSLFTTFYLSSADLSTGWASPGTTYIRPHHAWGSCFLLPSPQPDMGTVEPAADTPGTVAEGTNLAQVNFFKAGDTTPKAVTLKLNSYVLSNDTFWQFNYLHGATSTNTGSFIQFKEALPSPPESGYRATFYVVTSTQSSGVAKQSLTLTLDNQYTLTDLESNFFTEHYGLTALKDPTLGLIELNQFMQRTSLNAEQAEALLSQRTQFPRLSPNCPSTHPQHAGMPDPKDPTKKILPFPHASHYGACYVNGTGSDLYDSTATSLYGETHADRFDNSMGLEEVNYGTADNKIIVWYLSKTSLNRFDRLQRMIRLQRWTGIPFAELDTLIISAMRAEGERNLGLELNTNTLRALGVYRYLEQRFGIKPQEFAALLHDLSPYAIGDRLPLFDEVFNRVKLFDTALVLDQTPFTLDKPDAASQKTLLQLCAGLRLQPTEDSLLPLVKQTNEHFTSLKRDLSTVTSIYRQARIARMLDLSPVDFLALADLLGGAAYKTALTTGLLASRNTPADNAPDILDILMQMVWAVDWLKESQQSVPQLRQLIQRDADNAPPTQTLKDRVTRLVMETPNSLVTEQQLKALNLPANEDKKPASRDFGDVIDWFKLLQDDKGAAPKKPVIDAKGLVCTLPFTSSDETSTQLQAAVKNLIAPLKLVDAVKQQCLEKLSNLLLKAHDQQAHLIEGLLQEIGQLPIDRAVTVVHWAKTTVNALLTAALGAKPEPQKPIDDSKLQALIALLQPVFGHAQASRQLHLSNNALRLFVVSPAWLGLDDYPPATTPLSLANLYLLERFTHWLNTQKQPEEKLLNYFSIANPPSAQLKNKALRKAVNEDAASYLATLLEWNAQEITVLSKTLPDERARSMAHIDWLRRCQAACKASGLSAAALLLATHLNEHSTLADWKPVGEAVMAASHASR